MTQAGGPTSDKDSLAALCGELARLGLGTGLRDASAEAAIAVHTGAPGTVLWISVSDSGTHFTWQLADHRHPVDDVPGAARQIADFVRSRPQGN